MSTLETLEIPDAAHGTRPAASDPGRLLAADVRLPRSGPADAPGGPRSEDLATHRLRVGPRPRGTAALVDVVEAAGLTGRGGARFPTAVKWRAALRSGRALTVVANGAESEPLAAKDGTLLRQRPHLVLDGLALAAEALRARRAVVWLHGDDDGARVAVERALDERRVAGEPEPAIEVVVRPAHYLAGEASAIARALAGGAALPTMRRATPATSGAPHTLVQNVETLGRVALLAHGRQSGGTTLLTVLTASSRYVVEVADGTPLLEVLARAGVPSAPEPQAVLLAGFGGAWAPWDAARGAVADEAALRTIGLTLGSGVLAPLPHGACGVSETAAVAAYLSAMSARQCGPCAFGLPALSHSLDRLARGRLRAAEHRRLTEDLDAIRGRGACHHPDGAVRLVTSALDAFADDVAAHLAGRPCARAGLVTLPIPAVTR